MREPATIPPTIWPCGPASEMVKLFGIGGNDVVVAFGRKVAEMDKISKRP
jgi:hypothetical protein